MKCFGLKQASSEEYADIALLSLTLRVVLTTADELEHMLTGEDDF